MTDKEKLDKLVAEIERRLLPTVRDKHYDEWEEGGNNALINILSFYNSMQEEPASEDFKIALEKKVREAQDWTYIEEEGGSCPLNEEFGAADLEEFAEWGASWMRDQMMKDAVDFTFTRCCSAQLDMDLHAKGLDYGDEVKLVIIKKE